MPLMVGDNYQQRLSTALHESERDVLRAFAEVDAPPILIAKLTASQTLPLNTPTTVVFDSAVDTAGWWDGSTYMPTEAGFYRCSWAVSIKDTTAIAASTYGSAQLGSDLFTFHYGNGSGLDIDLTGSAIVECDGQTGLSLTAFLLTGTSATITGDSPARTWLCIDYLGRRAL